MWTKYIVATLLLASTVLCSSNLLVEEDISEEKYPFLVSLRVDDIHWCVGTIVAPKWALAAAHCTDVPPSSNFSVQYGVKTPSRYGPNVVSVKKAHVYRGWNVEEPLVHDIALFELEDRLPIDYKTVAPVNLPVMDFVGETEIPTVFSSWTLNQYNGTFNEKIEEIPLKIQTREQCGGRLSGLLSPFGNICTSSVDVGNEQQCFMFGGPLLYRGGTQLAIATFQKDRHYCVIPDVYTKVSMYVPWILSTIEKAEYAISV